MVRRSACNGGGHSFTLQYDQANGSANFEAQTGEDGKVTEAKYTGYTLSDDKMSIS